jgi:predicted acetyltransferase
MLERLRQCALGSEIASGFVAHETFWLVADGGQVVAVSNLRLSLTPALRVNGGNIGYGVRPSARRQGYATTILRETLARAKARGLERVLVTAHRPNLGSVRAILNNGGILDSEELLPGQPEVLQRYWITT